MRGDVDHGHRKAVVGLEFGKKDDGISIALHSWRYYSLCTSASRPRPPIKAYLSWGKSFMAMVT